MTFSFNDFSLSPSLSFYEIQRTPKRHCKLMTDTINKLTHWLTVMSVISQRNGSHSSVSHESVLCNCWPECAVPWVRSKSLTHWLTVSHESVNPSGRQYTLGKVSQWVIVCSSSQSAVRYNLSLTHWLISPTDGRAWAFRQQSDSSQSAVSQQSDIRWDGLIAHAPHINHQRAALWMNFSV